MARPRAANISRMRVGDRLVRDAASTPITSAIASRVMSSCVGPRPPHTITASASPEREAQRVDDPGQVVAHLHLEVRVDARRGQLLADPRRVGVDDLAEQQLGADGDDLTAHRHGNADLRAVDCGTRHLLCGTRRARAGTARRDTTVRTTATHSRVSPEPAASTAVSGSSAKPTPAAGTAS